MASSNVVKVNILGQEYVISTSADPRYIKEVAAYMNIKMEEQLMKCMEFWLTNLPCR